MTSSSGSRPGSSRSIITLPQLRPAASAISTPSGSGSSADASEAARSACSCSASAGTALKTIDGRPRPPVRSGAETTSSASSSSCRCERTVFGWRPSGGASSATAIGSSAARRRSRSRSLVGSASARCSGRSSSHRPDFCRPTRDRASANSPTRAAVSPRCRGVLIYPMTHRENHISSTKETNDEAHSRRQRDPRRRRPDLCGDARRVRPRARRRRGGRELDQRTRHERRLVNDDEGNELRGRCAGERQGARDGPQAVPRSASRRRRPATSSRCTWFSRT